MASAFCSPVFIKQLLILLDWVTNTPAAILIPEMAKLDIIKLLSVKL